MIRHAKSSWEQEGVGDIDRPLSSRGRTDAASLGHFLGKRRGTDLELLISSNALRARTTAQLIAEALALSSSCLRGESRLYSAGVDDIIEVIRSLDDEARHVAIVGHNPAMHELAEACGCGSLEKFATCGAAHVRGRLASWRDFTPARVSFVEYVCPKLLSADTC